MCNEIVVVNLYLLIEARSIHFVGIDIGLYGIQLCVVSINHRVEAIN